MKDNIKIKKIIAREILLFFIVTGILLLIFAFLAIRNLYCEQKRTSLINKQNFLLSKLSNLPKDRIKILYDSISNYLAVNYELENKTYSIVKEQEHNFIYDESGNPKKVMLLPAHPKFYFYYYFDDPLNILSKDSTLVFDFVKLDSFRELIRDKEYQDKLYSVFSNKDEGNIVDFRRLVAGEVKTFTKQGLPVFNRFAPYGTFLRLGTIDEFESNIQLGLLYTKETAGEKIKMTNDYYSTEESINKYSSDIWDKITMSQFILYTALIFGIMLYPLRFFYILISWSIKTLNGNKN